MIRKFAVILTFAAMPLAGGTRIWTGAPDAQWSNPANWNGGGVLPDDDLVFPQPTCGSNNDLPAGLHIHSISYFSEGCRLAGAPIVLGAGGFIVSNRFLVSIVTVRVDAPIALASSQTWTFAPGSMWSDFAAVDLGGNTLTLDVNSHGVVLASIRGSGAIVKRGSSTLFIQSTFNAPVTIAQGTVQLEETTTGAMTVATGTTLEVWPGVHASTPSTVGAALFEPGAHFASHSVWLEVLGRVAVNNAILDVSGTTASQWLVIKNDGTDSVSGTFLGLPEGAIINEQQSAFDSYRISYVGGDGNDVTLTRLAVPAQSTITTVTATISRQNVTLAAAVPGAIGSVSFYDAGVLLGTAPLDASGNASLTAQLGAGPHEVTAAYTGAEGFATSRAAITVAVPRSRVARH